MRFLETNEIILINGGHGHEDGLAHLHIHDEHDLHGDSHASHTACACRTSVNSDVLPLLQKGDASSIEKAQALLEKNCAPH